MKHKFASLVLPAVALAGCQPATAPAEPTAGVEPTAATARPPWTYESVKFELPLRITLGPEWRIFQETPDALELIRQGYGEGGFYLIGEAGVGDPSQDYRRVAFPEDFVGWISSHPDFVAGPATPVTVAGIPGVQIDAAHAGIPDAFQPFIYLKSFRWNAGPNEIWRFILLDDVYGERVLFMFPAGSSVLEEVAGVFQEVLEAVEFIAPVTYQLGIPIVLSYGPEWIVLDDRSDLLTLKHAERGWELGFNLVTEARVADPTASYAPMPWPEDFIGWLLGHPEFSVSEPVELTLGGVPGIEVDATATVKSQKDFILLKGIKWNVLPAETWRMIYLPDVGGERMLITIPAGSSSEELAAARAQAQQILDTLKFVGLP